MHTSVGQSCCCSVHCFFWWRVPVLLVLEKYLLLASYFVKEFNNPSYWLKLLICSIEVLILDEVFFPFVQDFLSTNTYSWFRRIRKTWKYLSQFITSECVNTKNESLPHKKDAPLWHAKSSQCMPNLSVHSRSLFLYFSLGFVAKRNFHPFTVKLHRGKRFAAFTFSI